MKLKMIAGFIGAVTIAGTAHAQSAYQAEVFGSYNEVSGEDVSYLTIGGRLHFSPVDTKNHPLEEAAFLERSSHVEASWTRVDVSEEDDDADLQSLSVNYYIPNSIFYVGAGIKRYDSDGDSDTQWNARLGITPIDGLLVWTEFYEDVDYGDAVNVHAKYVTPLAGEQALNLVGGYADGERASKLYIGADYYIDRHLSFGGQLTSTDYDYASTATDFEVRANNYFTPNFNVGLSYVFGEDEDSWGIRAGYRF